MANKLSLEERIVGHFLWHMHPGFNFLQEGTNQFLEDIENDTTLITSLNRMEIPYNDRKIIDLKRRNPFLDSNCYYAARELLLRAVERGDYDIKTAILDIISDPHGVRKQRYYNIAHDFGDGKQSKFVFFHELGIMLGIGNQVEEEVRAYTEAYRAFWKEHIKSGRMSLQFAAQKRQELDGYERCLTPEYKSSMRYPLLDGDRKILEILSLLTPEKLREYSNKYLSRTSK